MSASKKKLSVADRLEAAEHASQQLFDDDKPTATGPAATDKPKVDPVPQKR